MGLVETHRVWPLRLCMGDEFHKARLLGEADDGFH